MADRLTPGVGLRALIPGPNYFIEANDFESLLPHMLFCEFARVEAPFKFLEVDGQLLLGNVGLHGDLLVPFISTPDTLEANLLILHPEVAPETFPLELKRGHTFTAAGAVDFDGEPLGWKSTGLGIVTPEERYEEILTRVRAMLAALRG